MARMSEPQMVEARMASSTCPGPGSGSGSSRISVVELPGKKTPRMRWISNLSRADPPEIRVSVLRAPSGAGIGARYFRAGVLGVEQPPQPPAIAVLPAALSAEPPRTGRPIAVGLPNHAPGTSYRSSLLPPSVGSGHLACQDLEAVS